VTEVLHGLGDATRERVAALRAEGRFFWLDVSLGRTSFDDLVAALAIPQRAVRALREAGDRHPSRAFHADGESVVFALRCYVAAQAQAGETAYRLHPLEVHVLVTGDYLLTLHQERGSLPAALDTDLPGERSRRYVVYSVLEGMIDSTFDALEEVEVRLEALAVSSTDLTGRPVPRATLRAAAARLAPMRSWVTAQQAVYERLAVELGAMSGFDGDEEPSFDRLDGQVDRLLASIDAAANGMGTLLDLQLNERAYVVSVVATIFVPLTFITGFFGMNFGWMVDSIDSQVAFLALGIFLPVATAALAWRFLLRRFLIGGDRSRPAPERQGDRDSLAAAGRAVQLGSAAERQGAIAQGDDD
jgi:magnesium transporter